MLTYPGRVVGAVFNRSIPNATTDIFPSDIIPSTQTGGITPSTVVGQMPVAFRITVSVSAAVALHLNYTDGTTEVDVAFNGGSSLVANAVYTFTVDLPRYAAVGAAGTVTPMSFNFQLSGPATVHYLIVEEVVGQVI